MSRELGDLLGRLTDEVRLPLERASDLARSLEFDLYLVGGAVRDLLLGVEVRDLDLVWEGTADPHGVAQAFGEAFQAEASYRPEFLTASLTLSGDLRLDVGRARAESYSRPAALPQVRASGLAEDLRRRDFSVNAMAVPLAAPPRLIDPCGGAADLASRLLRILHEFSFRDDPTRILRGCELAVRHGLDFESGTSKRIEAAIQSGYLALPSGIRVRHEFERLLGAPLRAVAGASRLQELGIDRALHSDFRIEPEGLARLALLEAWPGELAAPASSSRTRFWIVALCALLWQRPAVARRNLAHWLRLRRADRAWLEAVPERLAPLLETSAVESSLEVMANIYSELSADEILLAELLIGAPERERLRAISDLARVELAISGADLLDSGIGPGPRVGEALAETLAARRRREIRPDGELAFALAWLAQRDEQDAT